MSIRVKCPECQKVVKGGDDWAGLSGKCPNCGRPIQFPAADPPTERQLNYAKKLRIKITPIMSKADVSTAIAQVESQNQSLARQRQHVNESRYKKTHGPELVEAEDKWQKLADANKWMIAVYQSGKTIKVSVIRLNEASITDKGKLVISGEVAEPDVKHNREYDDSLVDLEKTIDLPFEKIKWYEIINEIVVDGADVLNAAMNRGREAAKRVSSESSPAIIPATQQQEWGEIKIDLSEKPKAVKQKSTGWLSPLTTCRDCGGQVSKSAKFCPHCGSKSFDFAHSLGQFGKGLMGFGCLLMLIPLFLVILFVVFAALLGGGK
jgi:hypothetical protein